MITGNVEGVISKIRNDSLVIHDMITVHVDDVISKIRNRFIYIRLA
jgi:hypothetical protein